MKLQHYDKFKTLDNNQRIDALYQALESVFRGEVPEAVGAHDHDTRYYPRQIVDQSQSAQDLRLTNLERLSAEDLARDRKIAELNDKVSALMARPVSPSAPATGEPVDLSPVTQRLNALEQRIEDAISTLLQISDFINSVNMRLVEAERRQADDSALLDQMSAAAFKDLKKIG